MRKRRDRERKEREKQNQRKEKIDWVGKIKRKKDHREDNTKNG